MIYNNSGIAAGANVYYDSATGNVGIGTSTPSKKLHVNGNLQVDGYGGKTIYHRHMSAEWLNANATFLPSRTHTLASSRLNFGTGTVYNKLFEVPLVPAGTLSSSKIYTARIAVWLEPLTNDNDPTIGLSDGVDVVGFKRGDYDNGVIGWISQAQDGNDCSNQEDPATGGSSSTTRKWIEINLLLSNTTRVLARCDDIASPAVATTTRVIDRGNALKLVAFANDATEQYGFYSVEVTITEAGP